MLGSARFFYEGKFRSGDDIKKLKELIKLINVAHLNEYDNNFNNEDFNSLYNRFETRIEQDFEQDQLSLSQQTFSGKSNYDIVPIDSFEESSEYRKYTTWCVADSKRSI